MISNPKKNVSLFVIIIIAFGLILRVLSLPNMLFDFDEGIASIYALQLTHFKAFPLYGVRTSLGFTNTPLFIWLFSPAFIINPSPMFTTGYLQILYAASLFTFCRFLISKNYFYHALSVALFGMLSPGVYYWGLRLWGHALIPTASILTLLGMLCLIDGKRTKLFSFLIPVSISFAQQVHFSGALLAFNAIGAFLLYRPKLNYKYFAIGIATASLSYLPWIIYQFQNSGDDLKIIWQSFTGTKLVPPDRTRFYSAFLNSLSDFGGQLAFQEKYIVFINDHRWINITNTMLAGLWILAFVGSLTYIVKNYRVVLADRKSNSISPTRLLCLGLLWTMIPLIAFSIIKTEPVAGYWLPAFPGPWLLIGSCLQWIMQRQKLATKSLLVSTIALYVGYAAGYIGTINSVLKQENLKYRKYPTYSEQVRAVQFVLNDSKHTPAYLRQELRRYNTGIDYNLTFIIALLDKTSNRVRPLEPKGTEYVYHNRAFEWPNEETIAKNDWQIYKHGLVDILKQPSAKIVE